MTTKTEFEEMVEQVVEETVENYPDENEKRPHEYDAEWSEYLLDHLSDNELIGIPFQIIIGKRDLKNNLIELKNRSTNESKKMSPNEVINFLLDDVNIKK